MLIIIIIIIIIIIKAELAINLSGERTWSIGRLIEPMKRNWLIAELPQLDVAISQTPGADQQRKAVVTFHKTNVSDTSRRQVESCRRLGVTTEEKPGDCGTGDTTRIAAVGTPLQLDAVTLYRRRNQTVARGNQDCSICIECNVRHGHTWMAYVRERSRLNHRLTASRFRQSNSGLDKYDINTHKWIIGSRLPPMMSTLVLIVKQNFFGIKLIIITCSRRCP